MRPAQGEWKGAGRPVVAGTMLWWGLECHSQGGLRARPLLPQ